MDSDGLSSLGSALAALAVKMEPQAARRTSGDWTPGAATVVFGGE
jgi:hypothetical protein